MYHAIERWVYSNVLLYVVTVFFLSLFTCNRQTLVYALLNFRYIFSLHTPNSNNQSKSTHTHTGTPNIETTSTAIHFRAINLHSFFLDRYFHAFHLHKQRFMFLRLCTMFSSLSHIDLSFPFLFLTYQ